MHGQWAPALALQEQTDEVLGPVLAAYDERQAQARMDSFLPFSQRFAKFRSKRLKVQI